MKKNYFKTVVRGTVNSCSVICLLAFSSVNAQTEVIDVVITGGYNSAYANAAGLVIYPRSEKVTMTGTGTHAGTGTTFNVSFDVTPAYYGSSDFVRAIAVNASVWGSSEGLPEFKGSKIANATIGNIQVFNFSDAQLSESNITAKTFAKMSIKGGNGATDRVEYLVGGTSYYNDMMSSSPQELNLLTDGSSPLTTISSFVLQNGSEAVKDVWAVENITVQVTVDKSLGVHEFEEVSRLFKLYPNPAVDNFSLSMPISSAKIIDMTGRVVKTYTGETANFDISNYAVGTYILKGLSAEGATVVKRFTKSSN